MRRMILDDDSLASKSAKCLNPMVSVYDDKFSSNQLYKR